MSRCGQDNDTFKFLQAREVDTVLRDRSLMGS